MNPRLFVYGTLLSNAGHPMGERLRREARLLAPGTLPGRLHSLGRYPGLVETADTGARVHGEVYALDTPTLALRWLDAYEGIVPGNPEQSPYERAERPVRLQSGTLVAAWVYLYRRSVTAFPVVEGGRWIAPEA